MIRTRALIAACVGAVLCVAGQAGAQETRVMVSRTVGGPGGMGTSTISKRSVDRWAEELGLDDEQKQAVLSLHEGYRSACEQASREMATVLSEARKAAEESQDHSLLLERLPPARRKQEQQTRAAEQAFMSDVRSLLTPDQERAWPKIERMRRREQSGRMSTVSGDAVDLTEIIRDLKLPVAGALAEALEEYEVEADRGIQERLRVSDRGADFDSGRPLDLEVLQKQMDEQREAGLKLKDINLRHARKIEPLLPEAKQAEFRQAFKRSSFPQVYRPTMAGRWLEAAQKFDDLDTRQREDLAGLRGQYERDLGVANDALAAAIEASEARSGGPGGVLSGPGVSMVVRMGDEDSELAAARKARREVDERAREKLRNLLKPEQRERLPKPEEEAQGAMMAPGAVFVR
jgi:Spy/CpxP family protein refolding chaperone